ncbi:MAG: YhbY family RNA-binding protein, partial [Nanoarchaeota archaeon]
MQKIKMTLPSIKFQIGKGGVTDGVISALAAIFKSHKQIRISMLKSSGRDRNSIEKIATDISRRLSENKDYYVEELDRKPRLLSRGRSS